MLFPVDTFLTVTQDYRAVSFDDASVERGDTIRVIPLDPDDDARPGWIKIVNRSLGPSNGLKGWIPDSIVEADQSAESTVNSHSQPPSIEIVESEAAGSFDKSAADIFAGSKSAHSIDQSQQSITPTPSQAHLPNDVPPGTKTIARYDYEAQKSDELNITNGDTIHILASPAGGWWRGVKVMGKDSHTGWFPAALVEIDGTIEEKSPLPTASDSPNDTKTTKLDQNSAETTQVGAWSKIKTIVGKPAIHREKPRSMSLGGHGAETATPLFSAPTITPALSEINESASELPTQSILAKKTVRRSSSLSVTPVLRRHSIALPKITTSNIEVVSTMSLHPISDVETKSWKDDFTTDMLDGMTPKEIKRQEVIWELLCTERDYIRDLRIVIDVGLNIN
jgi:hypothetical protein